MSLSQDILGFDLCGEDQRPARALYGDSGYEAIVRLERQQREERALRYRTQVERIDDVAGQMAEQVPGYVVESIRYQQNSAGPQMISRGDAAISAALCAGLLGFWGFS